MPSVRVSAVFISAKHVRTTWRGLRKGRIPEPARPQIEPPEKPRFGVNGITNLDLIDASLPAPVPPRHVTWNRNFLSLASA